MSRRVLVAVALFFTPIVCQGSDLGIYLGGSIGQGVEIEAVDDVGASGPCHSELGSGAIQATGQPNPVYRPTVNAIGRRFYVDESITYEVFAKGVVMF